MDPARRRNQNVPPGLNGVTAISAGGSHCLALCSNGTVVAWGDGRYGQCLVPVFLTNAVAIAAGDLHSLALRRDGTVVAWGAGQAGWSNSWDLGQSDVPAGLSNVVAVFAGGYTSFAIRPDGTVVAWGYVRHTPQGLKNVVALGAGYFHAVALQADGTVVGWEDYYNQVPPGLTGAIAIAADSWHSLAIITAPTLLNQPQSQTAEQNTSVQFRLGVAGGLLSCQWFFNATNLLAGRVSPVLEMPQVQFTNSGAYTLIVTNLAGAVTSTAALLNVISPMVKRAVPALTSVPQTSTPLNVERADPFATPLAWAALDTTDLSAAPQWYFDIADPLAFGRLYRASQTSGPPVSLRLNWVTAISLGGSLGGSVRLDYIPRFGPIDAWTTLAILPITNSSQTYFDTSAVGQPARLYRLVPIP